MLMLQTLTKKKKNVEMTEKLEKSLQNPKNKPKKKKLFPQKYLKTQFFSELTELSMTVNTMTFIKVRSINISIINDI